MSLFKKKRLARGECVSLNKFCWRFESGSSRWFWTWSGHRSSVPLPPPSHLSLTWPTPCCGEPKSQNLFLRPGVGQYIAIHATLTARDVFLASFYPSDPFTCIPPPPPPISRVFPVLAEANTVSVWARRINRSPCSSLQTIAAGSRV